MTPHFARELEQRRRDLLNPPEWEARRRKREARRAKPSSFGVPKANARNVDPLNGISLTVPQLCAVGYWRALVETDRGAAQAGITAAQLREIRAVIERDGDTLTYDVAKAVVIEGQTVREALRRRGMAGTGRPHARFVACLRRALSAIAVELMGWRPIDRKW